MSSHFIRLFVFLVVASSCGPQVADPPITLSDEARVNKVGATWFFVSPIRTTYPSNAARFQYAVRVRETTGAFLANPVSKTVTYTSTPTQVEVPIEVKTQVGSPRGFIAEADAAGEVTRAVEVGGEVHSIAEINGGLVVSLP